MTEEAKTYVFGNSDSNSAMWAAMMNNGGFGGNGGWLAWILLMVALIGYARSVDHASGGEFIIALLLWLDVTNRLIDRYWK